MLFCPPRYFLIALEAIFLIMLLTELKRLFVKYVLFSLKAAIVDVTIKYFTGVSKIALLTSLTAHI